MSKEFWDEVLSEIDDKFVEEAAEADVTEAPETLDDANFTEPVVATKNKKPKRKIALISTLGGLAAALAIAVPIALNANLFNLTGNPEETTTIDGIVTEPIMLEDSTPPYPLLNLMFKGENFIIPSGFSDPEIKQPPELKNSNDFASSTSDVGVMWSCVYTENYVIRVETPATFKFGDSYMGDIYLSLYDLDGNMLDTMFLVGASGGYYFDEFTAPDLYVWGIGKNLLISVMPDYSIYLNSNNDMYMASFFTVSGSKFKTFAVDGSGEDSSVLRVISRSFKVVGSDFCDIENKTKWTFDFDNATAVFADDSSPVHDILTGTVAQYGGAFDKEKYDEYLLGSWELCLHGACVQDTNQPPLTILHADSNSLQAATYMCSDDYGVWLTDYNNSIYYISYSYPKYMFYYSGYADNWHEDGSIFKAAYHGVYTRIESTDDGIEKNNETFKNLFTGYWAEKQCNSEKNDFIKVFGDKLAYNMIGIHQYEFGVLLVMENRQSAYYIPNSDTDAMYYYSGDILSAADYNVIDYYGKLSDDITSIEPDVVYKRIRNENISTDEKNDYYLNDESIAYDAFVSDFDTLKSKFMGQWETVRGSSYNNAFSFDYSCDTGFRGIAEGKLGWYLADFGGGCDSYYFIPYSDPEIMYYYMDASPEIFNQTTQSVDFEKERYYCIYRKTSDEYQTENLGNYGLQILADRYDISNWSTLFNYDAMLSDGKIYQPIDSLNEYNLSTIPTSITVISQTANQIIFSAPYMRQFSLNPLNYWYSEEGDCKTLAVIVDKDINGNWTVADITSSIDADSVYKSLPTLEDTLRSYLGNNAHVYIDETATKKLREQCLASSIFMTTMCWTEDIVNNNLFVAADLNDISATYAMIKDPNFEKWYILPDNWDWDNGLLEKRALTDEEIAQANEAFKSTLYDEATGTYSINPVTTLFNQYFTAPILIDINTVVNYYPYEVMTDDERYQIVRKELGRDSPEHLSDWVVPFREIPMTVLDEFMKKLTGIEIDTIYAIQSDSSTVENKLPIYCMETSAYYNCTSDGYTKELKFIRGEKDNGDVKLYTADSVVTFEYYNNRYIIKSYQPLGA